METETKHTPGPWYKAAAVTKGIDNYIEIAIFSDVQVHPYRTVAKIISPLESIALANAELIARAPELLEQLKQLKEERKELVEALERASCPGQLNSQTTFWIRAFMTRLNPFYPRLNSNGV